MLYKKKRNKHKEAPCDMFFIFILAKNPCQQNSIGCEHICFLSGGVEKCDCRPGYALKLDGKTCTGMCAICLEQLRTLSTTKAIKKMKSKICVS